MRIYFFIVSFLIGIGAYSQEFAFEFWHEGKIMLEDGTTLKGSVKYDMQTDLVQLKVEERYESFTARKVLSFEIYDKTVKRYRNMYSLPYATSGTYKAPVFFELLEEGKITLLCREALEYRTTSSSFYYYSNFTRLVVVYNYFTLEENGDIIPFVGKKNDWLDKMNDRRSEVQNYAKDKKLDFDEKYDLVQIVTFYNSMFE